MSLPESRVRILELAELNRKVSEVAPEDQAELEWCTKIVSMLVVHPGGLTSLTKEGVNALMLHRASVAATKPVATESEPEETQAKGRSKKKGKRGPKSVLERDKQIVRELEAGLKHGEYKDLTDYLEKKHPEYKDNIKAGRSWLSTVRKRVRDSEKRDK